MTQEVPEVLGDTAWKGGRALGMCCHRLIPYSLEISYSFGTSPGLSDMEGTNIHSHVLKSSDGIQLTDLYQRWSPASPSSNAASTHLAVSYTVSLRITKQSSPTSLSPALSQKYLKCKSFIFLLIYIDTHFVFTFKITYL